MDEADYGLLDFKLKIPKGKGLVIGFTATPFRNSLGKEADILKAQGFQLFDS